MINNIIYDVDLAADIKAFVLNNLSDIKFNGDDVKNSILNADDKDLLRIGKTINSPIRIVSVDIVDSKFFKDHLFTNGNKS